MTQTKVELIDLNGKELVLDADADTSITADTDDVVHVKTGGTDRLTVQSTAGNNVVIADGLTLTDGNVILASGHGINFAATADTSATNASADGELLDDYEEGTWEPTMADQNDTAFSLNSITIGKYTKIGRQVICSFYIITTSINSASGGFIKLEGLPFVHENVNYTYGTLSSNFGGGLNIPAGTHVTGYVNTNQSYAIMSTWDLAAGTSSMQPSEWSDNGQIGGTLIYMTSA